MSYNIGGQDFHVEYPLSSVTIPSEAKNIRVDAFGGSIHLNVPPSLSIENNGVSYDWDGIIEGAAFSENLPFDLSGILKVYNDSFAWNLSITRA